MPWYPGSVRKEVTRHRTPMRDHRAVVLHVAVSEASSLYGYFNQAGNPTSHFYVRRDGTVEQYVDTRYQAPAQLDGNPTCLGIETQGLGSGQWTSGQVEGLADLCAWAAKTHGVPLRAMQSSRATERGVGYHRLGVDPWRESDAERWSTSYGKTCPGADRIPQVPGIITRAGAKVAAAGGISPISLEEEVILFKIAGDGRVWRHMGNWRQHVDGGTYARLVRFYGAPSDPNQVPEFGAGDGWGTLPTEPPAASGAVPGPHGHPHAHTTSTEA